MSVNDLDQKSGSDSGAAERLVKKKRGETVTEVETSPRRPGDLKEKVEMRRGRTRSLRERGTRDQTQDLTIIQKLAQDKGILLIFCSISEYTFRG